MRPCRHPKKIDVLWFLPTHGDNRYLGTTIGGRNVDFAYLKQVAIATDSLGYTGVLIPTGRTCEDSWVVASALAPVTERLKFLIAVRPGLLSPTLAARMTASLDRLSNGRLLINVVTGGDPVENKGDGIHLSHSERYEVTEEFLGIYKALLRGETVNTKTRHFEIEDGRLHFLPVQEPRPPLFFGGSSEAGHKVAARSIDKYLTWGEPPEAVAAKIKDVRRLAEEAGREVSFGIRLHVIVRETEKEAWAAAEGLIQYADDETIAAAQKLFQRMDSVGQSRMSELHGGRRDRLEISPNLWAGVGLLRGGAGTALVGDPEIVRQRIDEYRELGIDTFVLSGYPHLEEAWRFGELVLPHLPLRNPVTRIKGPVNTGPFGEVIAAPKAALANAASS